MVRVWDLPTRLVHWLVAALIPFSWWSVKNHHTDWHIWSGIAILTLLLFRLLWGLVGSSTARFSSFVRGPRAVLAFLRDTSGWRRAGHNPLGALSVILLLLAMIVQVGLGLVAVDADGLNEGPLAILVSLEQSEAARVIHQRFSTILLALIVLHLAAILFYRLALGKKLTGAMLSGRAALDPATVPMQPAPVRRALLCAAIALALTAWTVAGAPPFGA